MQDFDRKKLEESLRRAGASADVARSVSERIQPSEGMSTSDIRARVKQELARESPEVHRAYSSTRVLRAKASSDMAQGLARLHQDILRSMEASSGGRVNLRHGERRADLRVEASTKVSPREIHLSRPDLESLRASDGARIAVTQSR